METLPNFSISRLFLYMLFSLFFLNSTKAFNISRNSVYVDRDVKNPHVLKRWARKVNSKHSFSLFTHGKPGELLINNRWLNPIEIVKFLEKKINHLEVNHINIYGCEFGKGSKGRQAVIYIENALGITISASDDITGKDGDWELEVGKTNTSLEVLNYPFNLQCIGVLGGANPGDDFDGDGICNEDDLDDDNDGILDTEESSVCNLDTFSLDGMTNYEYWQSSPLISDHVLLPISLAGGSNPRNAFADLDEYGMPTNNSATTSSGMVAGIREPGGTDVGAAVDALRWQGWVFFPESLIGTTIKVRTDQFGSPGATGGTGNGAWVISSDYNPSNWIDPVNPSNGEPLLDMGNTLNFSNPTQGWNQPPIGYTDSGTSRESEDFEAEIVVQETGHYISNWQLDPQVAWGAHSLQYSTDGGTTWTTLPNTSYSSQAPCLLNETLDTDNDGIPNHLDLDSDGDGCPDAVEAGINTSLLASGDIENGDGTTNTTTTTDNAIVSGGVGVNGLADSIETDDTNTGTVNESNYTSGSSTYNDYALKNNLNVCLDNDNDGIPDFLDVDDDNDGILDTDEGFSIEEVAIDGENPSFTVCGVNNSASFTATGNGDVRSSSNGMFRFGEQRGVPTSYTITFDTAVEELTALYFGGLIYDGVFGNFTVEYEDGTTDAALGVTVDNTNPYGYSETSGDLDIVATTHSGTPAITNAGSGTTTEIADQANGTVLISGIDETKKVKSITFDVLVSSTVNVAFDLSALVAPVVTGDCSLDTDNDGIPNHLDLDSDNDGCPDSLEGDGGFTYADLEQNSALTTIDVDADGVPTVASGGQADVSSTDVSLQGAECDSCNPTSTLFVDADGDGVGNDCDIDDDNDGILDTDECTPTYVTINWTTLGADATIIASTGGQTFTDIGTTLGIPALEGVDLTLDYEYDGLSDCPAGNNRQLYINGTSSTSTTQNRTGTQFNMYDGTLTARLSEPLLMNWLNMGTGFQGQEILEFNPSHYGSIVSSHSGANLVITDDSIQNSGTACAGSVNYGFSQWQSSTSLTEISVRNNGGQGSTGTFQIGYLCDVDGDGIINSLDLDSDGDGCPDAIEASVAPRADLMDGDLVNGDGTTNTTTNEQEAQFVFVSPANDANGDGLYDGADGVTLDGVTEYTSTYSTFALDSSLSNCNIDLTLTKTVNNVVNKIGDMVVYTLTVNNTADSDATGVEVSDVLPTGLTYISDNSASTSTTFTDSNSDSIPDVWSIGNLAAGSSISLEITVNTDTMSGPFNNISEIKQANEPDEDSTPNNGQ